MNEWLIIEADLRKALLASGRCSTVIDTMLGEFNRAFVAVERARGKIDDELLWALVAVQADRYRRRAVHARMRKAS